MKELAASTTATGRNLIMSAKKFAEEEYNCEVVYGDSVVGYSPVIVKHNNEIHFEKMENISLRFGSDKWIPCKEEGKQDKEACELNDVYSWTNLGWSKIHRIIRHQLASHKKIIRVLTHTGCIDVTDDHSLLFKDGTKVSPKDLKIGDEITLMSPSGVETIIGSMPKQKTFIVTSIFNSGLADFDNNIALINLDTLDDFFDFEKKDRNLEIYLKNPKNIEKQKFKLSKTKFNWTSIFYNPKYIGFAASAAFLGIILVPTFNQNQSDNLPSYSISSESASLVEEILKPISNTSQFDDLPTYLISSERDVSDVIDFNEIFNETSIGEP